MFRYIIRLFKNEYSWYFRKSSRSEFKSYAKLILDKYAWEIKNTNSIPDLIQVVKNVQDNYNRMSESLREEEDKLREKENRLYENTKRFEIEIKHLKDLIQAKNLIIDKLQNESIGA